MSKTFNTDIIKKVFETMEYSGQSKLGSEPELPKLSSNDGMKPIPEIVSEFLKLDEWTVVEKEFRCELIRKLSDELMKHTETIVNIELKNRNVPAVFSRNAVKFLASSLNFYSNFSVTCPVNKQVCIIEENHAISLLSYILGPALSLGCKILIIVPSNLINTIEFIKNSMLRIGFPKGTMDFYPEEIYRSKLIDLRNYFDDLEMFSDLNPYPTPVIILEDADLDSACECVSNNWNDLLFIKNPKEVFVQESIYESFLTKFNQEKFQVTAFRNLDEGLKLANNNAQGLAASVWTENIGMANYAAKKLEVANVWINCFGVYSPEVAFFPQKSSASKYKFGGSPILQELKVTHKCLSLEKVIVETRKHQMQWNALPRYERVSFLRKMLASNEKWSKEVKSSFDEYILNNYKSVVSSPFEENFNLNVQYEPKGILVIQCSILNIRNDKLLISGLIEGNSFIIQTESKEIIDLYSNLSKNLPKGILNVSSVNSREPFSSCSYYYVPHYSEKCVKLDSNLENWESVLQNVTFVKNIWSNIG